MLHVMLMLKGDVVDPWLIFLHVLTQFVSSEQF